MLKQGRIHWQLVTLGPALALAALGSVPASSAGGGEPARDTAVVLELFTSQGCSTCPPAERVLTQVGLDEATRGRIVPLVFHVDYWNEAGWVDPFSAREWTARQAAYDHVLGKGGPGMYTPQLVVNGSVHFPGGNEPRVRNEIAAGLAQPTPASVSLAVRKGEGSRPALNVDVTAELTESVPARKLQVLVALFENQLVTQVARGENGGRTLQGQYVVRRLENAFSLDPKPGTRMQRTLSFKLDPAWKPDQIGVAAFVQDPRSMKIYGACAGPSSD